MFDKLKAKMNELPPDKKRMVVFIITGVVVCLFLIGIFVLRSDKTPPPPPKTVTETQDIGVADAEKATKYRMEAEIKRLNEEKAQRDNETKAVENAPVALQLYNPNGAITSYPLPPNMDNGLPPLPAQPNYNETPPEPVRKVFGIASIVPEIVRLVEPEKDNVTVKTNFIPANTKIRALTLNGVYAPTRASGKSSPYPVILRVHDMAFLPNDLKRDLKGCELQGEAHGELQEARVHIRITKITCVSRDGRRVLEKDMEGWVNGEDGIVGMAGVVEDNFGMLLSKTFLAQTLAGLGEALEQSTQVITTNPLGGISQYTESDYEDMAYQAAGKGLGESFGMIAEFMMDLLRDQSPVIRVNARRQVDVVVRTGLELITDEMRWVGVVDSEHQTEVDAIISELKGLK